MQQHTVTPVTPSQTYRGWQRLAWATLVVSFLIFLAVVFSFPHALRLIIESIRQDVSVPVRVISGQEVFVHAAGSTSWIVRFDKTELNPGDSIRTDENSRAFLVLPDDSTVQLYPNSSVTLAASNLVRYQPEKMQIILEQVKGKSRIAVSPVRSPENRVFHVRTPTFTANLLEGSYAVEVIEDARSSLAARLGNAVVTDGERVLSLSAWERVTTENGQLPTTPLPAAQDLVQEGDFAAPEPTLRTYWAEEDRSIEAPSGTVAFEQDGVHLKREGEGHGETVLIQQINRDVWDFEELVLRARVKVIHQSLPGGGRKGAEYPILIRIDYRDINGEEREWFHGFYYYVPTEAEYLTMNATKVEQDAWYTYEKNILQLAQRPIFIRTIEVVASGRSYEGVVQYVSLVGE
ncbi:MAG: FecR domain-containing protein [Chloroflexota bacterium]|nr:FecR domain-containing protein [Chloroflexota bacterium]MDE2930932.1 FecR domain-containing protein [Chloroflexota bacterium]